MADSQQQELTADIAAMYAAEDSFQQTKTEQANGNMTVAQYEAEKQAFVQFRQNFRAREVARGRRPGVVGGDATGGTN